MREDSYGRPDPNNPDFHEEHDYFDDPDDHDDHNDHDDHDDHDDHGDLHLVGEGDVDGGVGHVLLHLVQEVGAPGGYFSEIKIFYLSEIRKRKILLKNKLDRKILSCF